MNKEEMFEVLGDFDPSEHDDEARRRWGDSDLYRESARRTKGYTKGQWLQIKRESDAIEDDLVALMQESVPVEDPRVMAAAERHRLHIAKWFYPCSPQMHGELGKMYVADERFSKTYENRALGLAQYICDAVAANAARVQ